MYLVVGANGFLGANILRAIGTLTKEQIIATTRNSENLKPSENVQWIDFEVTDGISLNRLYLKLKDDSNLKIVYLAAYHDPNLVEENPISAWDINVTSLFRFIEMFHFAKALYYSSSDSVYGNSVDGYHYLENDRLLPVNLYGKNKCAAEKLVINAGFHVVRFPFLIGPSLLKHKKHFYDEILDTISHKKTIEMFADSYRSSLDFKQASELLIQLIESKVNIPSIVNICGDDDLSKFDVGVLLAKANGIDEKLIIPLSINDNNKIFKVTRATNTLMSNFLLKSLLGVDTIKLKFM